MTNVDIIAAPLDLGADRGGVDRCPFAIGYAGLSEKLGELGHNVANAGI